MPLLFSYGTLQLEAVQMATFGRQLTGTSDALRGFELVVLKIEDPAVVAISGKAHHTMATVTGRPADVISGTVAIQVKWQRGAAPTRQCRRTVRRRRRSGGQPLKPRR